MRTIAITINKGGVGKATVTKNLATAASPAGLQRRHARYWSHKPSVVEKLLNDRSCCERSAGA